MGSSGDEGIDGIIKEDRLGLEVVYIQARRWENTVHRPEIQKFVGALSGQNARKGVFMTTASFSTGAVEYAKGLSVKVVLIDEETLTMEWGSRPKRHMRSSAWILITSMRREDECPCIP